MLILDDVWFEDQLAAFPVAGRCARLVTTRVRSLVTGRSVPVTLLTTATALGERAKTFTDCYGGKFGVADHRRVYRFRHDPQALTFRPPAGSMPADPLTLFTEKPRAELANDTSATLAHAARATAGYPAAFEPVQEHAAFPNLGSFRFPSPSRDSNWLIDGGVLDNTPFEPLLREIAGRPVDGDWQRVIGFITASDGLAGAAVRTPGRPAGKAAKGWAPVLVGALRMASETSFRIGVQALVQQSLNAQRHVTGPEQLFVRTLADPDPFVAAAEAMYDQYRHHRVDSGILDACLIRIEAGAARPVCFPYLQPDDPDYAPLWVPPVKLDEALANHQPWRWGSTVADRTVRLLIHHLHAHLRKQAERERDVADLELALGKLSTTMTAIAAVREVLVDDIPDDTAMDTPSLREAVNAATERSRSPEVLGALMDHAATTYADAMPDSPDAAAVLKAALVVDVIANAASGKQPFTREAQFSVIRMGPDIDSPVVNPAATPPSMLGEWKLYGTQLGHFGAFGCCDWRKRDHLWGRLDGAAPGPATRP